MRVLKCAAVSVSLLFVLFVSFPVSVAAATTPIVVGSDGLVLGPGTYDLLDSELLISIGNVTYFQSANWLRAEPNARFNWLNDDVAGRLGSLRSSVTLLPDHRYTFVFTYTLGISFGSAGLSFGSPTIALVTADNRPLSYSDYQLHSFSGLSYHLSFSLSFTSLALQTLNFAFNGSLSFSGNSQEYSRISTYSCVVQSANEAGVADTGAIDNAGSQIGNQVNSMAGIDDQVFNDINSYKDGLDFGVDSFNDAITGLDYVRSIFMVIWSNSPTAVITLSMMLGLAALLLGRGVSYAIRNSNNGDSRSGRPRDKGG